MTNDMSLLKPFDITAAKAGEKFCWFQYTSDTDLEEPSNVFWLEGGKFIPVFDKCYASEQCGIFSSKDYNLFRMVPLCWIEGKPVYKGDELWYKDYKFSIIVEGLNNYDPNGLKGTVKGVIGGSPIGYKGGEQNWAPFGSWTWNKPKTAKTAWINIYDGNITGGMMFETKENAIAFAKEYAFEPIATVQVNWEE